MMYNNLDYLYSQLNELNSKIGSTYNYIDSNNLSDAKINQLNLKCDYMMARADKIQAKINMLEDQSLDPNVDLREDHSNMIFIIASIIFSIIILIYTITTIL